MIKPQLCDYSDTYILVTGDIAVVGGNDNTKVCFKNCGPFTRCLTHLNDEHVQYKRQEQPLNAAGNIDNLILNNSSSFKYNSSLLERLTANVNPNIVDAHRLFLNAQLIVPLKYISSFFRSL